MIMTLLLEKMDLLKNCNKYKNWCESEISKNDDDL